MKTNLSEVIKKDCITDRPKLSYAKKRYGRKPAPKPTGNFMDRATAGFNFNAMKAQRTPKRVKTPYLGERQLLAREVDGKLVTSGKTFAQDRTLPNATTEKIYE